MKSNAIHPTTNAPKPKPATNAKPKTAKKAAAGKKRAT
jgi:hypothetical protein